MRARAVLAAASAVAAVAGVLSAGLPTTTATAAPGNAVDLHEIADRALQAISSHGQELKTSPGETYAVRDVIVDRDGTSHVRIDRMFRGLPEIGGDTVLHQGEDAEWLGASQTLRVPAAVESIVPTVSAAVAGRSVLAAGRRLEGKAALVIDARGAAPRLAWQVVTAGTQPDGTPSNLLSTIDARTGAVLSKEERIQTADGQGRSLYSGTVPLQTTQSGAQFTLKDPSRGNSFTGDAENKTDFCIIICFSKAPSTLNPDADNQWGSGANADRQSAAVDAQYGTSVTWDYYKNVHGRNGVFGDGKGVPSRVHYGRNYANAFFNGTEMTYGDGDGTRLGPLVSLDVAAHEQSHGVTSKTANLTYSGESGGLNEATSDIFATLAEFYANNSADKGDYLIGEKVFIGGGALRYMDKPSRDGRSADCWSSSVGSLDVHLSSGVANHWMYLASEGSGRKTINGVEYDSPTCNGSTTTGIGRDAVGKIWYRALTVYMTSSTNFAGARTATLNAARDLYGATSAQYAAVAANWSAVNVN